MSDLIISPQEALLRCVNHAEISYDEMLSLFRNLMEGELSPVMIAALTMGLRVKRETVNEISAAASVMRELATKVVVHDTDKLLDIVGTGGDGAHTFNISTAAMFVAAAAGARVAKHGGRSVSSSSGSADVLEALGAHINLMPEQIAYSIAKSGIGFMFAPNHHAAMKHAAPVRKELGIRTIFNILGPLTNPASAANVLMGVFSQDLVGIQIRVLQRLGVKRALVVWGSDNLDEISLAAPTMVAELIEGQIKEYEIKPQDFDLPIVSSCVFKVKNAEESKQKIILALNNEGGALTEIVALNAGAALYAAGNVNSIFDGVQEARAVIASGAAIDKLNQFVRVTHELANEKR